VKEEKGYEKRKNAIIIKSEEHGQAGPNVDLRNKLAKRYRNEQEKHYRVMQDRVKRVRDGSMLQNYLGNDRDRRLPSVNSISSIDSDFSDLNGGKKKKKKKTKKKVATESSSDSSDDTDSDDSDDSTDSSGSSTDSETGAKKRKKEKKNKLVPAGVVPPPYMPGYPTPVYNPETGEMQMPMYPYPFFPPGGMQPMRGNYYPGSNYRGNNYRGPPRGRFPRMRSRGGVPYRGRGGYNHYQGGQLEEEEYYK
jgi:hypothetical protein